MPLAHQLLERRLVADRVEVGVSRGELAELLPALDRVAQVPERFLLAPREALDARGLDAIAVPKKSIWEEGGDDLRRRIDDLRKVLGPPWAEDQKLAALAAWIALRRPRGSAGAARSARGRAPTGSG